MTVDQLILSFKLKLDKLDSQAYPDILEEEIRFWLDEGADRFLKQRYERNNIKRKGFEETQKRTDDLRASVRTEVISAVASVVYPPGLAFEVPLPIVGTDRYRYLLKVQAEVQSDDCEDVSGLEWTTPYQVQQDDVHSLFGDPFNKPIPSSPLYTIEGNNIVFFTDEEFTIVRARISFIRLFDKLQPGLPTSGTYASGTTEYTELSEDTHEEIVDISVKMALENIESQRYQTNMNEITGQE
jgi:hypothetical protein